MAARMSAEGEVLVSRGGAGLEVGDGSETASNELSPLGSESMSFAVTDGNGAVSVRCGGLPATNPFSSRITSSRER